MHRQPTRPKWCRFWEFTHSIRTPFAVAADFNMEPDQLWETWWVQSLGLKASTVVPEVEHTCTTGRGRIIDFAVISDSVQPFWRGIALEYNSPCKPHIGICLQFTATPTQVRVRQACFPKSFAFPKTVEEVVLSRKRMKSKTKPEEPRKREVKFVCQAERWKSALQSRRKTRAGTQRWFLSLLGFQLQERKHAYWSIVFRNSCRTWRSALLRRMASLSMSASDMVVDLQG